MDIDYTQLANRVAHKILETEQCPYEASVNLVITDNEEIKEVNAQFRNINAPTDVLSFPMIPFPSPADYSIIEDQDEYFDLDTDELLLGDVMISVDRVYAQAEEYGHSTEREFSFLLRTVCFIFWDMITWNRKRRLLWKRNSQRLWQPLESTDKTDLERQTTMNYRELLKDKNVL